MFEELEPHRQRARTAQPEEFVRELGGPVLLIGPFTSPEDILFLTNQQSARVVKKGAARRLVRIRKRAGSNAFTAMITVGRTPNNDIILDEQGVSKFHAYFTLQPAVVLVDSGSRFGTFVAGRRLEPRTERVALTDGVALRFGEVEAWFYTPDALRAELLRS